MAHPHIFPWMVPGASADPQPCTQAPGWLVPRLHEAVKVGGTTAVPSLVLQAAAELPPAPLPGPASSLEAEGLQFLLEGLMVHGPIVLGLTEGRVLWEEVLVAAFEDVHLGIV